MKNFKKLIKNDRGMSLIELTVAAAVSVVISAAVMQTNQSGIKGVNNVSTKLSLKMWQANVLTPKLSDPDTCRNNFAGLGLAGGIIDSIVDEGGNAFVSVGQDLANTGGDWAVAGVSRGPFVPDIAGGSKGNCDLTVRVTNKKTSYGAKEQSVKLPMRCTTDAAVTTIQSCSASMGSSDSLWSMQLANGVIEEFVYRNGNVVIGPSSSAPQAPFQIDMADTVSWPAGSGSALNAAMKINGTNRPLVINNRALWDDGECLSIGQDTSGGLDNSHRFCGRSAVVSSNPTTSTATASMATVIGSSGAQASASQAVVIGSAGTTGFESRASANGAVVLGASNVTVSGVRSVGMGEKNIVSASNSYAFGKRINLSHSDSMVLGTMSSGTLSSSSSNEFTAGFDNGYRFFTNPNSTADEGSTFYISGTGNVGIGAANPLARLVVGENPAAGSNIGTYIAVPATSSVTHNSGVSVRLTPVNSAPTHMRGVNVSIGSTAAGTSHNGWHWGVFSDATMTNAGDTGRAWGVWGQAGNAFNGYNYGVMGLLAGTQGGAGVYGGIGSWNYDNVGSQQYAGYFKGQTRVNGDLQVDNSIKVGATTATCNAASEGTMRYDSATKAMQFCNGTAWSPMGGGSSAGVYSSIDKLVQFKLKYNGTSWSVSGSRVIVTKTESDLTKTVTLETAENLASSSHFKFRIHFNSYYMDSSEVVSATLVQGGSLLSMKVSIAQTDGNNKIEVVKSDDSSMNAFQSGDELIILWGTPRL